MFKCACVDFAVHGTKGNCILLRVRTDLPADQRKSSQSSRDRSRQRDSEKSREQKERDMLSFEKIRVRGCVVLVQAFLLLVFGGIKFKVNYNNLKW